MKTLKISLVDTVEHESVQAEHYVHEDGWIQFKDGDHKIVVAYPAARVSRIKSEDGDGEDCSLEDAWDEGFTACANEHFKQSRDHSHPIIRTNPHRSRT